MSNDLHPFAAAGNHGEDGISGCDDPHIVLQLRHVFRGGRLFRKRPRQHELAFEHRIAALDPPVKRGRHPAQCWMADPFLHIGDHVSGIGLVPASVQVFRDLAELDDEIARQIFGFDFAALLTPEVD